MSFSICARVGEGYGVAVAGRVLAVGTLAAAARPGVGAVCVLASPTTTREALLDRLEAGLDPRRAVDEVTATDPRAGIGQIGLVGRGGAAAHTGSRLGVERGQRIGGDDGFGYAVTGHLLAGPEVLDAMEATFVEGAHLPLVERLVAALAAGDGAGGDLRGRQSACVVAVEAGAGIDGGGLLADLRVDDHEQPVTELARLVRLNDLCYGPVRSVLPLEGPLLDEVRERLARLGLDGDVEESLHEWATPANLRRRLVADGIDARLLQVLREATIVPAADTHEAFPSF